MVETVEPPRNSLGSAKHQSHRILVAEDDVILLRLTADMLMNSGFAVDVAEDGEAAWRALTLNAGVYDLLITDNNMPKVTGMELIERLRDARIEVPVVLVSGQMPMTELERHPQPRAQATLLKPYTIGKLLGTVEDVLSRSHGSEIKPRSVAVEANHQPYV